MHMKDYDIVDAIEAIENELIRSMCINFDRHRAEEMKEGYNWEQWQAVQLKELELYKKRNTKKYGTKFKSINRQIETLIRTAREDGKSGQEVKILEAIKKGFKGYHRRSTSSMTAEFFKINDRKLEALIEATIKDMEKAETAILRMANDQYRKIIFNAQVYANTGAGTYEKAVDMATKNMLAAGLNCVEYKNGSRHTLKDYADMAIRTAAKRAYLQGEGIKRQEWGISTVIMNKRGNPCPKCLPFVGKILIDDVWSGGQADTRGKHGNSSVKIGVSPVTGLKYPLISAAIAAGLYHPRCKDSHTTYFEGISTPPDEKYTKEELNNIAEDYQKEQKQRYAKKQAEKYERLEKYSLDEENKRIYGLRANEWKKGAEEELSKKKHENKNTVIDSEIIYSNVYRERINTLDENTKTKRNIWKTAVEILSHRTGTEYEDLAFIHSGTGKSLVNKNYDVIRQAKPNKRMKKLLSQSKPYTIIAIHNHPGSGVPSLGDIRAAYERKYKYGIVVCHNGTIYKYSVSEKYNDVMAISALARLERRGYNEDVRNLFIDAGIEMEVL
ncbi:MAG: phage minor capsid protein [Lachnospiraceae bacterium]|nr:phage minor capsid protein [Lachnospiraceae bacterium]